MALSAPTGPASDPAGDASPRSAAADAAATEAARRGLGPLGWIVIGGLTTVLAAGFGILYMHVGQTPGISAQTTTWNVRDASTVEVSYEVSKPEGERVRCTVDAFDGNFEVIAQRQIVVPAGRKRIAGVETLTTPRRANGARVRDCAAA
ncbi:DUF4307 domain-containing protein [Actinomadura atramentaria]|uniref:DUF4307 domain-containing protein n=1 Tax=Actinomadura atramentaria TaxID=1990 RepID=UPI00037D4855|nr:DUF4307 domain-containing protein [Actinomadura atramentaria]